MRESNYDKIPSTSVEGALWKEWNSIMQQLKQVSTAPCVVVVECYQGIHYDACLAPFKEWADRTIDMRTLFKTEAEIEALTRPYLTYDRLFGRRSPLSYIDMIDAAQLQSTRELLEKPYDGITVLFGHGAAEVVSNPDCLIYLDMARWEIQMRSRRGEVTGLGVNNAEEAASLHYKRGYFVDWNICDALKKRIISSVDYWIDTNQADSPKMIAGTTLLAGLDKTVQTPFRVVPFFDPAPWGGQWMKQVCDLSPEQSNYGWCFDCVPEENSLYLQVAGELFEIPSNDLVFYKTGQLLGAPVEARFGTDFPIRFDFLDTMGGGNLSLQVHPTTQYIRDTFGIYYTQDESYYLLDAEPEASVYLGLKEGIDGQEMIAALNEAQNGGQLFDTERYVNRFAARKHDHYLIPAGTVHCSGGGAMVLEISATPSIFTFKLWDWERLGLDGLPRPINIAHGAQVIDWQRQTEWVKRELVNNIQPIAEGDGWREERTGLHENEFIETRRHWFTNKVHHNTGGGVNVLNVIEGDELVVESPTNAFAPFTVHYAETFIVPASVGDYTIAPSGNSVGSTCGTIKAFVRFNP